MQCIAEIVRMLSVEKGTFLRNYKEFSSMNTLPDRKYLITHSTMQGLCPDNNL